MIQIHNQILCLVSNSLRPGYLKSVCLDINLQGVIIYRSEWLERGLFLYFYTQIVVENTLPSLICFLRSPTVVVVRSTCGRIKFLTAR